MKEAQLLEKLRKIAIKITIDVSVILLVFNPIIFMYLWKFWWMRPIILWFSPMIFFFLFNLLYFPSTALFCYLTDGGKNLALKRSFIKCQLFLVFLLSKFMNGFELHGFENLPKDGGLVVYYHGPFLPVDITYVFSYVYLKTGRMIGGVMDYNFHQNGFFRQCVELFDYSSSREKLIEDLNKGHLRSVAPGGAYEGMFSENYELEWRARVGFARVAKEIRVPVVPMFTTNLQQFMPLAKFGLSEKFKEYYNLTKRPFFIPKGIFPVKMHTYLGPPLRCGDDEEPEAFAKRVKRAIEDLRDKHQKPRETVWNALRQRFC